MKDLLLWCLGVVASAFVGSYLAGYLRKKGENLATHEDLNKLVAEMEATTAATKAIEARISDEVWNRQRHWELKKEAVFSVMQALGKADDALLAYSAACFPASMRLDRVLYEATQKAQDAWNEAIDDFDQKRTMGLLVCEGGFTDALLEISEAMRGGAEKMRKDDNAYSELGKQLKPMMARAFALSRRELGTQRRQ